MDLQVDAQIQGLSLIANDILIALRSNCSTNTYCIRVVGIYQPYRNPPSKSSNGQPDQGLLQANFDLKAVTTSSFEMKLLDCPQPYPKVSK